MFITTIRDMNSLYVNNEAYCKWFDALLNDTRHFLTRAVREGHCYLYLDGAEVFLHIALGDSFGAASGDTEAVPAENINEVIELYSRFGFDGCIAWTSYYRQVDAVRYGEYYYDAISYLI